MPANPAPQVVACAADLAEPTLPVITDNCDNVLTPIGPVISTTPLCEGDVTYTYMYIDCEGNNHNWVYTYTIEHQDFTMPADTGETIGCAYELEAPALPTVIDNCGMTLTPIGPAISASPLCEGEVTYAYMYIDCKGNTHNWVYTYVIDDVYPPTGTAPADITGLQCISDVPLADINLITDETDNCGGDVTVSVNDINNGGAGCMSSPYIVTRTYTLTDCSGLTTYLVQTITVIDDTPPVITCPVVPQFVMPNSGPNYLQTGSTWDATATDNCSVPTVLFTLSGATTSPNNLPTLDGVTFNYGITIVAWTATDACGNTSSCSYTINVLDNTPPEISCPPAISVLCPEFIPDAYTALVDFIAAGGFVYDNDEIDTLSFTLLSQTSDGMTCPETITRIYLIADIVGNTVTCTQLIIVNDTVPPVISPLPEPYTVYCPAVPEFAIAIVSDNCSGSLQLAYQDVTVPGQCTSQYSVTRTWTATDACGNSTTAVQIINVSDTTAPVLNVSAEDLTVACDGNGNTNELNAWLSLHGNASVSDECSGVTWSNNYTVPYVKCGGTYTVNVVFIASDDCGNSLSTAANFTVLDNTPPYLSCSVDIIVNNDPGMCGANVIVPQPTFSDICGSVSIVNSFNMTSDASDYYPVGTTIVTWTATDACGNTSTCTMTVTVSDNEPPVIICPADIISCDEETSLGEPYVMDNCGILNVTNDAPPNFPYGIPTDVTWTVTDIYGNTSSCIQSVTISVITASAMSSPQVSCYNASDGIITVTVSGGVGVYHYSLDGQTPQTSNVFSGLPAGAYEIIITDENGCQKTLPEIIIANPPELLVTITGTSQVTCNNSSDGVITANATGGTGDYSYSLNGGPAQSSNLFTGLAPGSYVVTVYDENGCEAISNVFEIDNPEPLDITGSISGQISCYHGADGEITVNATGGTGDYSYAINGENPQVSNVFTGLSAGTYGIVVTDENGCTDSTGAIILHNPPQIEAYAETTGQVSCNSSEDGEITVYATGGTGTLSYSINGGPTQLSNVFTDLAPGFYTINVYDENGCFITLDEISINQPDPISLEFHNTDANCSGLDGGFSQVIVAGGTPPFTFLWSNGVTTSGAANLAAQTYSVTVTDAYGCTHSQSTTIHAEPRTELGIAKGFSPNGDGINDVWVVDNLNLYPDNEVVLINRWGNEIFTQKSYMNDWTGSDLLEGTYFYIIKVKMCEEDVVFKGYVTILR